MFSGGEGPWEADPKADAWWGDDPPFPLPVFVLTHHARETKVKEGGTAFNFVTDGIEAALEQSNREAAGEKDVAQLPAVRVPLQQYLKAGLLDEIQIHLAPVLLGDGVSLFDRLGPGCDLARGHEGDRLSLGHPSEVPESTFRGSTHRVALSCDRYMGLLALLLHSERKGRERCSQPEPKPRRLHRRNHPNLWWGATF